MGEYRQAFQNSNLIVDMGYTKGYKNTSNKKLEEINLTFFQNLQKFFPLVKIQKQILLFKHKMFQTINI